MSRRKFLQGALLTAAGAAAAACQPKTVVVTEQVEKVVKETVIVEKAAEEKEIRVLIAAWVRAITPIDREVAAFNESHPGVKVILEDSSQGWDTKVLAQIRAGSPAWSAQLGAQLNLARYVETGMVMPVGDYLEASTEPGAQGLLDDFHPLPKADCTYKGELYGISWRVDCDAFTYNKKMTDAVGMEEWPDTWEDIEELALEIVKKYEGEDVWGILLPRHVIHGTTMIFYTMVRDPWRDDGIVDITNPKYIEALKMVKRWQDLKLCPTPPWQDQGGAHMTLFEAGKAGMICTPHIWGKWAMYVQGSDVISYPVPMPPTGGKTPAWATPSHLFRNAPHPAETMDFVIYVFGPQNERMVRSCIEGRGLPCWKSAFENIVPEVKGMAWQTDLMEFIGDATPLAKTTTMGIQNDKIMAKIEDYLLGKIPDPEMAMDMALDEVIAEAAKQQVQ
jgi:ABC-type glycerol-3-phosphate transport system substrate-binding protein